MSSFSFAIRATSMPTVLARVPQTSWNIIVGSHGINRSGILLSMLTQFWL